MPIIEHEAGDLDTLTKRATFERDAAQRDRLRVAALAVPSVNTGTMNVFLGMLSTHRGPADHAVLIMTRRSGHKAKKLRVPENITILYLPPYSPSSTRWSGCGRACRATT